MMRDAQYWDDFLSLVDIMQEPWAKPEDDTQAYREKRAVRVFNAGWRFFLPALPTRQFILFAAHCCVYCVPRSRQGRHFCQRTPGGAPVVGGAHFALHSTSSDCGVGRPHATRM